MCPYLFVAGAFQDIKNPVTNNTNRCDPTVEGLLGKPSSSIAVRGMADAELICASIILPEFGSRLDNLSPIRPPKSPPSEPATTNIPIKNAVFSWEKPVSSSHMGANDKADQGNEPVTP